MCAEVVDDEVTLGGVPLTALPRADVRRRIVVSDTGSTLFSGRLGDRLDVSGTGAVHDALATASTEDILEALADGMDTVVAERGRTFSGGQRQRLVLARALAADPEILVLVEPTSAVDAHTEARIAARLRDHRAGRTTVVVSSSPLVLDAVDEVAFLSDGRVAAVGTYGDLLGSRPDFRAVVTREAAAGGGPAMSTSTALPIADSRTAARVRRDRSRAPTRGCCGARSPCTCCAALAALAAPRLLGDLVEAVDEGTTTAYVDQVVMWLAGFLVVQTVLTRYARFLSQALGEQVLARLREDFVEQRPRAAGGHRRVGRLGRPPDPHQPRRRPARLVGALGAAGVDDRGRHGRGHLHRRDQRRLVGDPPVPPRAAAARRRPAVVPRAGRRRATSARARRTPPSTRPSPRRSRGRAPSRRSGSVRERVAAIDDDITRVVRRRALHAVPADGVLPEHGAVLPDPHGGHPAARRLALQPAARSPSARSPRRRCTCRC